MKKLISAVAVFVTGCLFVSMVHAGEEKVQLEGAKVGVWTMDFDAATELAKEKKLPMMLNFTGSDWCGWCKLMDEGVFAKEEWKSYAAENVVLVTLDFPHDKSIVPEKYVARNNALKEQFAVGGFPTYVILDSDGVTKIGQLGAGKEKTPASFIAEFELAKRTSASGIAAYRKEHPDKADAFEAAIAEVTAAKTALTDWIATRPERNDENNKKFEAFKERIDEAQAKLAAF